MASFRKIAYGKFVEILVNEPEPYCHHLVTWKKLIYCECWDQGCHITS